MKYQCSRLRNHYRSYPPSFPTVALALLDKLEKEEHLDESSVIRIHCDDSKLSKIDLGIIRYSLREILDGLGIHNKRIITDNFHQEKVIVIH